MPISETFPPTESVTIDVSGGNQTISPPLRGLYIGGAGNVVYRLVDDGADHTITAVAGLFLPGKFVKITQTGTTATNMKGFR